VGPEALDEAERAGLVRVRDGAVMFGHPLVRTAVYQAATAAERRRAHAAIAATLRSAAELARRAWHLALAAAQDDEAVVAELEDAAAQAAARGGFAAASAAMERDAQRWVGRDLHGRGCAVGLDQDGGWVSGRGLGRPAFFG
jgi:hypothetical protein